MKEETGGKKAIMLDLLERKMDKATDSPRVSSKGISSQDKSSQVISDEVTSQDTNITTSQVINNALVRESVRVAYKERPRVSFWSPKVSAILHYLKKTVPDFSKSEEVESLLEEVLEKKYPELYDNVTSEMEKI